MEITGEIFEKLKQTVEYNGSAPPKKGEATAVQKRSANMGNAVAMSKNHRQNGTLAHNSLNNAENTSNHQLETDWLSTEALEIPENILYCPNSDVSMEIMKRNKLYAVPFLYTTFQSLSSSGITVETTGEIFEKLKQTVEYNGSAPPKKGEATAVQKRSANMGNAVALSENHRQNGTLAHNSLNSAEKTSNHQLETDWLSTEVLEIPENILYCPNSDVSTEIVKRNKLYAVPFLYTTFQRLSSSGITVETTGEIFENIKQTVEVNGSAPQTKGEATTVQKNSPNLSNAVAMSKNNH